MQLWRLLELKGSGASKLLSNLVQADIIEPVSGYGKGKYKFKIVVYKAFLKIVDTACRLSDELSEIAMMSSFCNEVLFA